jgi:hypothetical protein
MRKALDLVFFAMSVNSGWSCGTQLAHILACRLHDNPRVADITIITAVAACLRKERSTALFCLVHGRRPCRISMPAAARIPGASIAPVAARLSRAAWAPYGSAGVAPRTRAWAGPVEI